jgi:glycosyltransferase involved in cell wall biosynthesis
MKGAVVQYVNIMNSPSAFRLPERLLNNFLESEMPSLSVVIIACNEERGVADVLSAVKPIADEIIFVDSGSTDRTVEIAKGFGVKFFHQDWLGFGPQKNYAISLATCDWILSLDADEIMTPQLVAEIAALMKSDQLTKYNGYRIPRILYVGDTGITHGGFYPDAHLRLFKRGKGTFKNRLVHESLTVDGPLGDLKHPLKNHAYDNIQQFSETMEKYARLSAKQAAIDGFNPLKLNPLNEIFHPWWTFFYRYVVRRGFLDGALGFKLQLIYSDYVRRKIRYLRQANQVVSNCE